MLAEVKAASRRQRDVLRPAFTATGNFAGWPLGDGEAIFPANPGESHKTSNIALLERALLSPCCHQSFGKSLIPNADGMPP